LKEIDEIEKIDEIELDWKRLSGLFRNLFHYSFNDIVIPYLKLASQPINLRIFTDGLNLKVLDPSAPMPIKKLPNPLMETPCLVLKMSINVAA